MTPLGEAIKWEMCWIVKDYNIIKYISKGDCVTQGITGLFRNKQKKKIGKEEWKEGRGYERERRVGKIQDVKFVVIVS